MFVRYFVFPSHSWIPGSKFCVKAYKTIYYKDPLLDFIYIWHDGRYRSKVLLSAIPTPGPDLEVKVTELEFLYKSQIFVLKFI